MSPASETRILFVGDMHLGRPAGGLPAELAAAGLGPAAALDRVVDAAREHEVHAVAFAGDLVDGANALFEAYGLLEAMVEKLAAAGVSVVAVAGNHDTRTLPRLADQLGERFCLLGAGGTWSSFLIPGDAPLPVRLVGWSFPHPRYDRSPLEDPPPAPREAEITLGLLHADLDGGSSPYAPVAGADLRSVGYRLWFLGHIHRPDPLQDDAPGYLGSLSPLDPTETGVHGPVLVTVDRQAQLRAERLPLAPLRWEHTDLACPPLPSPRDDLGPALLKAMLDRHRELESSCPDLVALGFRLTLGGRHPDPRAVHEAAAALKPEDMITRAPTGAALFVNKLTIQVHGAHDLAAMARHTDPAGLLARRILELEQGSGAGAPSLLTEAGSLLAEVSDRPDFQQLPPARKTLGPRELQDLILQQAYRILDALVEQGGGAHGTR